MLAPSGSGLGWDQKPDRSEGQDDRCQRYELACEELLLSVRLKKLGIDPATEVDFKQFPGPLLRAAVEKGEAHALADNDPITYLWIKDGQFAEISSI